MVRGVAVAAARERREGGGDRFPGATVGEAAASLAGLRRAAAESGATLMGSGLHPAAPFGSAELVEGSRYAVVADEARGLLQRTPESALHVHVGLPDERAAVRAFNGLRREVPLLVGLAIYIVPLQIGARDEADRASLEERRAVVARELGEISRGRGALAAYGAAYGGGGRVGNSEDRQG